MEFASRIGVPFFFNYLVPMVVVSGYDRVTSFALVGFFIATVNVVACGVYFVPIVEVEGVG